MTAYVIAHLQDAPPSADVAEYIERISATFQPHGGRFLVHAEEHLVKEGSWPGQVVIIGFPGLEDAERWWGSPEYQQIAPLRARNIDGDIIMVQGVPDRYDPGSTAAASRAALDQR